MNIYLVRHADYEKGHGFLKGRLPVALSSEGIKQAENLKEYFKNSSIDIIYSSAVERCKQTAGIISDNKIEVKYTKHLLEALSPYQGYMHGDWSSYAYTHQEELGGETINDVYSRIVDFYEDIKRQNYKNVIICSHGDPLYFLHIYLIGGKILNDYKQLRKLYPEYQTKASIRLVKLEDGVVKDIQLLLDQEELID